MDKAAATSAPFPLRLGEHDLKMQPMRDVDIGELDQWVRSRYIESVRATLDGLSKEDRKESLEIAFAQAAQMFAFDPQGSRILATPEGLAKLVQIACGTDVPWDKLYKLMFDPGNADMVRLAFQSLNPVPKSASRAKGPATRSRSTRAKSTRRSR